MVLFRCLSIKGVKGLHIKKKKKIMSSKLQSIMYNSSEFPFSLKLKQKNKKQKQLFRISNSHFSFFKNVE